jgi:hypothetical protein
VRVHVPTPMQHAKCSLDAKRASCTTACGNDRHLCRCGGPHGRARQPHRVRRHRAARRARRSRKISILRCPLVTTPSLSVALCVDGPRARDRGTVGADDRSHSSPLNGDGEPPASTLKGKCRVAAPRANIHRRREPASASSEARRWVSSIPSRPALDSCGVSELVPTCRALT